LIGGSSSAGSTPCHSSEAAEQVELLGEVDEQLAARLRLAGLDEAEVLGGYVRLAGELELAHPPLRSPEPDQLADRVRFASSRDHDGHATHRR
jgi:hypothetical protein